MKHICFLSVTICLLNLTAMEKPDSKRLLPASASLVLLHKRAPAYQSSNSKKNTIETLAHAKLTSPIFIAKKNSKPAIDTIWHAIERDDVDAVNQFISQGFVNLRLCQTMHEEQLISGRVISRTVIKPETDNNTPLIHAALRGKLEIVQKLLAAGADPNMQNAMGHTALTSCNIHTKVMQALLDAGANPNVKTSCGYTALMYALMRQDFEQTLLLLHHGADPDIANPDGYTARFYAIEAGNKFIYLLSAYTILSPVPATKAPSAANITQTDC